MEFTLDTNIAVPPLLHRYEKGEWTLLYDPTNHSIVRANLSGMVVIEALTRNPRLADAISYIADMHSLTFEEAAKPVVEFVINLVNTGFLHMGEYRANPIKEDLELGPPEGIYIQNTERCNLKCVYCYNAEERAYFMKEHPEMTTEQMKWAIDQIADFGIKQVNFCGGEATLRDDLLEVAIHAKSRGRYVALVTNGRLDTDEFTSAAANIFDVIWVSLDSHKKELMEIHRGAGSYEPAVNSLRKLARVPNRNARIVVSSVVSDYTWQDMAEFKRFCLEELGVDKFRATTYCPTCSSSEEMNWPIQPPPFVKDDTVPLPELVQISDFATVRELELEISKVSGRLEISADRRNHCGSGKGELSMLSNGDLYPCQLLCKPQYLAGNIFDQSLADIFYSSEILKKMRDLTVDKIPGCSTCDVKYICGGGCRAIALEMHGSIRAHNDHFCNFLHRLAVDAMWRDSLLPIQQVAHMRQQYLAAKEQLAGD
jgi:radical SAM protein with 4Fe4S-binding SPASM domain